MTEDFACDLPDVRLADVRQAPEPVRGMTLWTRMRLSFHDMRGGVRELIGERPTEPRLLFFVLMSDVIFFLGFGVQFVVAPSAVLREALPMPAVLGFLLVGVLLVRTALMYVLATVIWVVGRWIGGTGSGRDVRAGVFWASLLAAPVGVSGALLGAVFANLESAYPVLATPLVVWPPFLVGVVAFVYFTSAGVAEAHGFRATSAVFVVFSVLTIAALLAGMYLMATTELSEALESAAHVPPSHAAGETV